MPPASSYNNALSESRRYNVDNTLASIVFTDAAIGDLSYGWDENKNKTSEMIGGTMSGYGFAVGSSGYDDEDRLVIWQRSDTNLDQSWNLSTVGNWTSITENASTQNRTHGPTHELLTVATQSVTHDAKGNMTLIPAVLRPGSDPLKMKWDFENKLIAADTDDDSMDDIFYKFDALGRRVGRDDGTANVVYFHDGQQTIADYPSGTAATTPTYTYVYASYIDEPVMRRGSGDLRYYHRNQQYSITAISDEGGAVVERYAYSAYGQVTIADASGSQISNSAILNRYTYTGREWDEGLSLYHYRARMYDAVSGRFVSRDPIGYEGSTSNLYEFLNSSPILYLDYDGNFAFVLPIVIPAGIGLAALQAAAIAGGVSMFACLMLPECLGRAKDETLRDLEDKLDDFITIRIRPKPEPRWDTPYFPPPPLDRDCDERDDCDSKYPDGYDSCDDFSYSSAQAAADATWGRCVTLCGERDAYSCANGIGTHQNAFIGGQFMGSVLCCDCCDDSLPGVPSDGFGCKTQ